MPDKKPTDAEIKKALECCIIQCSVCKQCPLLPIKDNRGKCYTNLKKQALDLINRLQADVDNYKQIAENQQKIILDKAFENKKLKAEIERKDIIYIELLKTSSERAEIIGKQNADIERLKSAINGFRGYEEQIKAEAYKEFAKRLKKSYCEWSPNDDAFYDFVFEEIDNLLKELVGEDNGNTE